MIDRLSIDSLFRKGLLLIALFLPFQALPRTIWAEYNPGSDLPLPIKLSGQVDEATLFLSIALLFTFVCLRSGVYRLSFMGLGKWITLFMAVSFVSIALNGVRPLQGLFGVYDLLKNIMFLFVFQMLRFGEKELQGFISALKYVGIILAIFAVIGELLALFFEAGIGILVADNVRYGLYRVLSLSGEGNHNYIGVFAVFVFSLIFIKREKRLDDFAALWMLAVLIMLTFSRQAWLGFVVMLFLLCRLNTKLAIALLSVPLLLTAINFYEGISEILTADMSFDPEKYFRLYAFIYSLKILGEHIFLGLGPGTFGGLASILFESGVYEEWPAFFKEYAFRINGIDQFWPVVWAETGVMGMLAYSMIFVALYSRVRRAYAFFRKEGDIYMYSLGRALTGFTLVIVIMGFAGGLNSAFVIVSFLGTAGMYLSRFHEESRKHAGGPG
ncbi:MAG: hypothetical protein H3C68_01385 [Deltaproteobacteria bacterium]|nr:hypothetical protein [Deltaproteobacteria bacterium]MBZ0219093.1 hypothetical protein [Deltaproteobacteria bacterium]